MKFTISKQTRINKALQDTGLYSRREGDKLIEAGKVFVNNKRAILGQIVKAEDVLDIKDKDKELRYAIYNKPRGETTSISTKEGLDGLHPVGRLDKDSDGLIIYTNDPKLVEKILNPKSKIEKEYKVKIREKATPRVERILKQGITTQEGEYEPVKDIRMNEDRKTLFITLIEGKKHEIRRMLNALNLTIESLTRIRIYNLRIKNLKSGQTLPLTQKDFESLL